VPEGGPCCRCLPITANTRAANEATRGVKPNDGSQDCRVWSRSCRPTAQRQRRDEHDDDDDDDGHRQNRWLEFDCRWQAEYRYSVRALSTDLLADKGMEVSDVVGAADRENGSGWQMDWRMGLMM